MSLPRDDAVRRALDPWLADDRAVLLAVSGGPDSTALMHAAAELRRPLFVATVDHGLRPEAAAEAQAVAGAAAGLGLSHATLRWEGERPAAAIQAEARAARYRLLAAHARAVGADLVLTGHTRDDQAETVLMRLIAGSGPAGLAGMRPARPLGDGLVLARPFLGLAKADLVAWCDARGLAYARDPSNEDDRYGRVRLRRLMPLLSAQGLTAGRLATLAERASRDDAALEAAAEAGLAAVIDLPDQAPAGRGETVSVPLRLQGPILTALPEAVALRVLDLALDRAGGALPRRLERLERLVLDALLPALREARPLRRTLRGLLIAADPTGRVTIHQAPSRRDGLAAGARDLLGKGKASAYIGSERADDTAAGGTRPALPRD